MTTHFRFFSGRGSGWRKALVLLVAVLALGVPLLYWSAGFFERDPVHLSGMDGTPKPLVAVYFSGDMGLHYGMGSYVVSALHDASIPVYAVSSSGAFAHHHSRAEVDAMVADSIRKAMRLAGASRVVVMGQSFGADMVRVGLVHLPADLRQRVAALVLVVPGATAYFRADPLNIAYMGKPDAEAAEARALTWLPVTCIRGEDEKDSLCPTLLMPNVRNIALPGGHYLRMDHDLLVRTIFTALTPVIGAHPEVRRP